ncbi:DUF4185 domain-containing protein [Mycobacterium sp. RTGN5]|uniref:DUF4185 domain-containing protein n=1 Tax=Mycobacterium sp. RTGN5 TaxID=3016522 RepID=UPI0029C758EA|nr:DUF4185 domain-containing protein [Mycobacterium sp. RTGN5]
MNASACIGRIGGLALALGVGAVVASSQGVAWAVSPPDSSAADSPPSAPATKAGPTSAPASTGTTATTGATGIGKKGASSATSERQAGSGAALTDSAVKDAMDRLSHLLDVPALRAPSPRTEARRTTSRPAKPTSKNTNAEPKPTSAPSVSKPAAAAVTDTAAVAKNAVDTVGDAVTTLTKPAVTKMSLTVALPTGSPAESAAPAPVALSAPAGQPAAVSAPRLVTGLLAALGFGPLAGNSPLAPAQPPVLWGLLAWARREFTQTITRLGSTTPTSSTPVATAAYSSAPLLAAAVTAPVTTRVGWVTGPSSLNNTPTRFGVYGTDVGTMWDNGVTGDNPATTIVEQREVLIAFGDTFSGPNMSGNWRNNVLFRSADNVLSNGLYVPDGIIHDPGAYSGSPMTYPNFSREIIGKYGYAVGPEVTIIPTAGISVPGAGVNGATRQYVNFMSVRSWDSPGRWTTNYSGIIYSDDNGQNWTVVPRSSIRTAASGRSTVPYVSGNQNFQQGAFVKPPAGSADAVAGYVYSYGTPAGRGGTIYLSRVNEKQILDQTQYEYWNGSGWTKGIPSAAKPILPGTTTSSFFGLFKTTTYPSAGEMSVQYNTYLNKYVMLYADGKNNIVMRTSDTPQGEWSAPKTVVTSTQYPGLYAPMIHPWSGTSLLSKPDGTPEDPQYLYWNLSQWNEYNVALMRTDLSRV